MSSCPLATTSCGESRGITVYEEAGNASAGTFLSVSDSEDHGKIADIDSICRANLASVNDIIAILANRGGIHRGRVRSISFKEGEAGPLLAIYEGLQIVFSLLLISIEKDGRDIAKGERDDALSQFLLDKTNPQRW